MLTTDRRGERVAAYETLRGAAMAVEHLGDLGDDVRDVTIMPAAVQYVPDPTPLIRWRTAASAAGFTGLLAGAIGAAARWLDDGLSAAGLAAFLVLGAVAGMVTGVAVAGLDRRRDSAASAPDLRAGWYEVVCVERPDARNHALARWWDPDARPARVRSGRRVAEL
jgi:hypothetical protein